MVPIRIISLNKGWDILSKRKEGEWQDIQAALSELVPEIMVNPSYTLGDRNSASINPDLAPIYLYRVWENLVERKGWFAIRQPLKQDGESMFELNNVKNKVSSQLIGTNVLKSDDLGRFLLIDSPRSIKLGICDVNVALLPTDDVCASYSKKVEEIFELAFNENNFHVQLNDLLPNNYDIPVVFVVFSLKNKGLTIEEMPLIQRVENTIERSIEFEPEYYQAGVGILSYFGKILRQKHPDINAKIRIEQDGKIVRMRVESPTGEHIDTLEEELTQYALVIQGKIEPENILDNPLDVFELKNKFEIAQLEVRQTRELLQYTRSASEKRITSLEEDVAFLRQTMGAQLMHSNTVVGAMLQQSLSHEKLQSMQIGHAQGLFKDLLGEAHGNQITLNAIKSLEHSLLSGLSTIDVQEQVKESLVTIQQNSPGLVARVAAQIESAGYGLLAAPTFEWLKQQMQ